jgi:manganese efflux pump family protein
MADIFVIFTIALGLAMDAFAVSIASGAAYRDLHVRHALRMAAFFGGFQALMPLVGFLAGQAVREFVAAYAHWAAFLLLTVIGLKMIYEAFEISRAKEQKPNPGELLIVLSLAVATSLDALAVGFTISLLNTPILASVVIIGVITFILSYAGVYAGKKFGHLFENKIEIAGGLILIAIGAKILLSEIFFK